MRASVPVGLVPVVRWVAGWGPVAAEAFPQDRFRRRPNLRCVAVACPSLDGPEGAGSGKSSVEAARLGPLRVQARWPRHGLSVTFVYCRLVGWGRPRGNLLRRNQSAAVDIQIRI